MLERTKLPTRFNIFVDEESYISLDSLGDPELGSTKFIYTLEGYFGRFLINQTRLTRFQRLIRKMGGFQDEEPVPQDIWKIIVRTPKLEEIGNNIAQFYSLKPSEYDYKFVISEVPKTSGEETILGHSFTPAHYYNNKIQNFRRTLSLEEMRLLGETIKCQLPLNKSSLDKVISNS